MNYNIELNDMLVFEDEAGNIYRDCVIFIEKQCEYIGKSVYTNKFKIIFNNDESTINDIKLVEGRDSTTDYLCYKYKVYLKEIWHKTDEDTYKKVWSK